MRSTASKRIAVAAMLVIATAGAFVAGVAVATRQTPDEDRRGTDDIELYTNEEFIERRSANGSTLDMGDREAVFAAVFRRFDDNVTVYPTENYYYVRFVAGGKPYKASLLLPADGIDEGHLVFAYSSVGRHGGGTSEVLQFEPGDDRVSVTKLDDFTYDVTYRGKTVRFHFNDVGMNAPDLLAGETYVGPVYDESGTRFHLVFNERSDDLYLLLDERGPPHEEYERVGESLLRGRRSGFVFYDDAANDRRVLIGVSAREAARNSWYDGPFDQMPDNYIKTGRIPDYREYLEAEYPGLEGKIDRYGHFLNRDGARVAVAPYSQYRSLDAFGFVEHCRRSTETTAAHYACLTEPR